MSGPQVEMQSWDPRGAYLSAAKKIMRAVKRGTGCRLTADECSMLDFAEGDGDWWNQTKTALGLERTPVMTNAPADLEQGARPFERWPGYDEQSWQQRFAELDRRYAALSDRMLAFAQPPASGVDREAVADARAWLEQMALDNAADAQEGGTFDHVLNQRVNTALAALTNSGAPVPGDGAAPWLNEVFRRNGPCPTCGTLGMVGVLEDRAAAAANPVPGDAGFLERLCRRVFLAAHSDGWTGNQCRRDVQHADAEKSWDLYVSNGALKKSIAHAAPAPSDGAKSWDHRYRRIGEGEIIAATDECQRDDGSWVPAVCVGERAPDPNYTSHRVYRRLIELEAAVPAGMVPYGPDHPDYPNAPKDWDDHGDIRLRSGTELDCTGNGSPRWKHHRNRSDVVAYTPKQATPTDEAVLAELIEAVRVVLCESNIVEEDLPVFRSAIDRLDAAYCAARSAPGSAAGKDRP